MTVGDVLMRSHDRGVDRDRPVEIAQGMSLRSGWRCGAAGDCGEVGRGLVTELRAEVHKGISDEEYVAALKVLRTMIANVEGDGDS